MGRDLRVMTLAAMVATILAPALAAAQAPPKTQTPIAPKTEQLDPKACANSGTRSTVGQGGDVQVLKPNDGSLSNKLARSDGVICPPANVDPEIKAPSPPGGTMQVIPPPGCQGGNPSVQPK